MKLDDNIKGCLSLIALFLLFFVLPIVATLLFGNGIDWFFSTEIGSSIGNILKYIAIGVIFIIAAFFIFSLLMVAFNKKEPGTIIHVAFIIFIFFVCYCLFKLAGI